MKELKQNNPIDCDTLIVWNNAYNSVFRKREKGKKKHYVYIASYDNLSVLHLHVVACLSGSMTSFCEPVNIT